MGMSKTICFHMQVIMGMSKTIRFHMEITAGMPNKEIVMGVTIYICFHQQIIMAMSHCLEVALAAEEDSRNARPEIEVLRPRGAN